MAKKKNEKQLSFAAKRYTDKIMKKLTVQLEANDGKPATEDELASLRAVVGVTAVTVLSDLNNKGMLR